MNILYNTKIIGTYMEAFKLMYFLVKSSSDSFIKHHGMVAQRVPTYNPTYVLINKINDRMLDTH